MTNDSSTILHQIASQAGTLYSLPSVAVQVLELTSNPHIDARALKQCIENDPALTTKVLRVVNSSLFGLSKEVSDLNQALALLGVKPLKLLVLGFSLPDALFAELSGDILQRFWQRTLTKAVAAREVCERFYRVPGDEAFIAALLQDLGVLVLLQQIGEPYAKFLRSVYEDGLDLLALERTTVGFDHTELSALLLATWGLPDSILDGIARVVRTEVDPADLPQQPLAQMVDLAEGVAQLLVDRRFVALEHLIERGIKYRRIDETSWNTLLVDLQSKVEQLADVLALKLPEGLDYNDVLHCAHIQLVEVAADAAGELARNQRSSTASTLLQDEAAAFNHALARFVGATPTSTATQPGSIIRSSQPVSRAPAIESASTMPAPTTLSVADDSALLGWLTTTVSASRQARCPVALLLVEVDEYESVVFQHGIEEAQRLLLLVIQVCRRVDHAQVQFMQTREARFGLILFDSDRQQAVRLANQLVREVRQQSSQTADGTPALTISVGVAAVALPPKNFPPQDLVEAADRCLHGALPRAVTRLRALRFIDRWWADDHLVCRLRREFDIPTNSILGSAKNHFYKAPDVDRSPPTTPPGNRRPLPELPVLAELPSVSPGFHDADAVKLPCRPSCFC